MSETWRVTKATVVSCRPSILRSSYGGEGEIPQTEYKANFTYTVNGGQFQGSMAVGSDWEIGRTFELSYDPKNPRRNTASRSFDPFDWRAYVYYAVVWGSAAVLLYLCIRYLPTESEMIRP